MSSPVRGPKDIRLDALENYLISMARSVELSTNRVLTVLADRNAPEARTRGASAAR